MQRYTLTKTLYYGDDQQDEDNPVLELDLEGLNITSEDDILDEAAGQLILICVLGGRCDKFKLVFYLSGHIQENLEDELVQEALKRVSSCYITP